MKVYIEELTMIMYFCEFDMYLNLETYECDYDKESTKGWKKIPTLTEKDIIPSFANYMIKEKHDYRFEKVLKSKDIVQSNHNLVNETDHDLSCEYIDYVDEYVKKEAISWCEKNNFPYTIEKISEEYMKKIEAKEKKRIEKYIEDLN